MHEGGVRWHVMGESHYTRLEDGAYQRTPDLTQTVISDWALEKSAGGSFFTRVGAVVENKEPGSFDRRSTWEGIAYSNFVQQLLDGPRKPPTPAMLDEARSCFFGQLAISRPDVLVVLGTRLWEELPLDGVKLSPLQFACEPDWPILEDAWLYPLEIDDTLTFTIAVKIVHPSAGFRRWNWRVAARRAHTAMYCHSNVIEEALATYDIS
ncbi:hypothetical protein [Sphingomonas sp. EC-HK361]|uniref:hypothetical protein n=1 Tax=Sphingomonas sp. EC-HK361 TaxID=2038397 RepID=UPI00125EA281|nr:hypothetical protein [Sphingomonas sp. EC-HK361]